MPSRGLLKYICDRHAQRKDEFFRLEDKYNQREEFAFFLGACSADMQAQLIAFHLDCKLLRAANDDLARNRDGNRKELINLWVRIYELEADLNAFRASPSNLANVVRDWDRYKVLVQSSAAQV